MQALGMDAFAALLSLVADARTDQSLLLTCVDKCLHTPGHTPNYASIAHCSRGWVLLHPPWHERGRSSLFWECPCLRLSYDSCWDFHSGRPDFSLNERREWLSYSVLKTRHTGTVQLNDCLAFTNAPNAPSPKMHLAKCALMVLSMFNLDCGI